jgi:hypothetical protein
MKITDNLEIRCGVWPHGCFSALHIEVMTIEPDPDIEITTVLYIKFGIMEFAVYWLW